MRAFVSGAAGFVGQYVVRELIKNNNKITLLVRNKDKLSNDILNNSEINIIVGDMSEILKLDYDEDIDIFYHFAWEGTSGELRGDYIVQLRNVQNTCDAVEFAAKHNAKRFLFAGSIMEYEAMEYVGTDNNSPAISNIYSTAKLTADYMAKICANKHSIDYINVIISNIYGVGERSMRFLNTTLLKLAGEKEIDLSIGTQQYDFIYVTDAARAIYLAAVKGINNNSYYIGNKNQKPLREYITDMKKITGSKTKLNFGAFPAPIYSLDFLALNTSRIYDELGFKAEIDFNDGITKTYDWLLNNQNNQN